MQLTAREAIAARQARVVIHALGWVCGAVFGAMVAFGLSVAVAQQIDPRLAGPALDLVQSKAVFFEAKLKVAQEDAEAMKKRLCELVPADKRPAECAAQTAEAKPQ